MLVRVAYQHSIKGVSELLPHMLLAHMEPVLHQWHAKCSAGNVKPLALSVFGLRQNI